jgi:hypothetical protein
VLEAQSELLAHADVLTVGFFTFSSPQALTASPTTKVAIATRPKRNPKFELIVRTTSH